MERLSLAALHVDLTDLDLPDHLYQVVGTPGMEADALASLNPHVLLIGFQNAQDAERKTVDLAHLLPSAALLLVGPALAPEEVVRLMRQGARDVVVPGLAVTDALVMTHRRYQPRVSEPPARAPGRLIVVHAPKGGSGKSTLAVNLAVSLATSDEMDVALVDLVLQGGDLDLLLDLKPPATWMDLAARPWIGQEELEPVLCDHASGLRLLAAPRQPEEGELIRLDQVKSVLDCLRASQAWTVVDTGPTLNEATLQAMELADHILVPVPLTLPALRQVQRGLTLWPQLGIEAGKVALVSWDAGGELTPEAAEPVLGRVFRYRFPYEPKAVQASLNAGQPLVLSKPNGAYARALRTMIQDLGPGLEAPRPGVLDWLKSLRRWSLVSPQQA